MSAVFFNPQLYVQKNDKFTTGIIYMPIILAYLISHFKKHNIETKVLDLYGICLLYTSPSPRDGLLSRMPSSA